MIFKLVAAAALAALSLPAQAETEMRRISPSIILMGDPTIAAPSEEDTARRDMPDVLADGERREAGFSAPAMEEMPVAEDETTSAIGTPPPEAGDVDPEALEPLPFEDGELRLGD